MSKTEAVNVKFQESDIHDIDFFAHGEMNYSFLDVVPAPEGKTLAQMFPRGSNPTIPKGEQGKVFIKMWYWIWSKYERVINSLMAQFKWGNLPENVKFWHLEHMLNKNGSVAMVSLDGEIVVVAYDVIEKTTSGKPTIIEIEYDNKEWDKHRFEDDEFVIIYNQPNGRSTFNDIIQYLEGEYAVLEAMRLNLQTSQPKGVFFMKAMVEENGKLQPVSMVLNAIAKGNKTFYTLSFSENQKEGVKFQRPITEIPSNKSGDIFEKIEFTDRTDNLIKNQQFWDNLINEAVGMNVNLAYDKKERVLGAEIESQNSLANGILQTKFEIRKEAVEEMNKVFNLKITIELAENEAVEKSQEQQANNETEYVAGKKKRLFRR